MAELGTELTYLDTWTTVHFPSQQMTFYFYQDLNMSLRNIICSIIHSFPYPTNIYPKYLILLKVEVLRMTKIPGAFISK